MLNFRFLAIVFVLGMLFIQTAFAQPEISGRQSGTLGPGQYLVVGDIQVASGDTLTILPGTEFLHNGHYSWSIFGQLNAEGAEGDSILFTRQEPLEEHRWGGLRFNSNSSDQSVVDYCIVEHCTTGFAPIFYGGGITIEGIAIPITNSRISKCSAPIYGGGIYCWEVTGLVIDNCIINDNHAFGAGSGGGIHLGSCHDVQISNCIITRNRISDG